MQTTKFLTRDHQDRLIALLPPPPHWKKYTLELLYDGTEAGKIDPAEFHRLCDNKPDIIAVGATTEGNVFGGYTKIGFKGQLNDYSQDVDAFIFRLSNKNVDDIPALKAKANTAASQSTLCNNVNRGPSFGGGHNIHWGTKIGQITDGYQKSHNSYETTAINKVNGDLAGAEDGYTLRYFEVLQVKTVDVDQGPSEIDVLRAHIKKLEAEIQTLNAQLAAEKETIAILTAKVQQLEARINVLQPKEDRYDALARELHVLKNKPRLDEILMSGIEKADAQSIALFNDLQEIGMDESVIIEKNITGQAIMQCSSASELMNKFRLKATAYYFKILRLFVHVRYAQKPRGYLKKGPAVSEWLRTSDKYKEYAGVFDKFNITSEMMSDLETAASYLLLGMEEMFILQELQKDYLAAQKAADANAADEAADIQQQAQQHQLTATLIAVDATTEEQ